MIFLFRPANITLTNKRKIPGEDRFGRYVLNVYICPPGEVSLRKGDNREVRCDSGAIPVAVSPYKYFS